VKLPTEPGRVRAILIRLPDDLKAIIAAHAKREGLSQNAWLVKALEWAVEQPVRTVTRKEQV
jgi:predicted HicB family RNase H-like nuclease